MLTGKLMVLKTCSAELQTAATNFIGLLTKSALYVALLVLSVTLHVLNPLRPLEEAAMAESWENPKPKKLIEIDLIEIQVGNAVVYMNVFPGKLLFASLNK